MDGTFSGIVELGMWNFRTAVKGTRDVLRPGDDSFMGPLTKADNHLIMGDGIGSRKKGVLGAHTLKSFDATLSNTGFPLEDLKYDPKVISNAQMLE